MNEYKWTSKMPAPFDEQSALPNDSISHSVSKINHSDKKSSPSDEKLSSRSQPYSDYEITKKKHYG